jgi:hypothetical protein
VGKEADIKLGSVENGELPVSLESVPTSPVGPVDSTLPSTQPEEGKVEISARPPTPSAPPRAPSIDPMSQTVTSVV